MDACFWINAPQCVSLEKKKSSFFVSFFLSPAFEEDKRNACLLTHTQKLQKNSTKREMQRLGVSLHQLHQHQHWLSWSHRYTAENMKIKTRRAHGWCKPHKTHFFSEWGPVHHSPSLCWCCSLPHLKRPTVFTNQSHSSVSQHKWPHYITYYSLVTNLLF